MMRGPNSWSVACRKPDDTIAVTRNPLPTLAERHKWLKWPMFRGCLVLGESLSIGIKALMISANHALEDEEEQLSDKQLGWSLGFAMILFMGIFTALPLLATSFVENLSGGNLSEEEPLIFNLIEGAIRLS